MLKNPTLSPAKEKWLLLLFAFLNFSHIVDFMIMMPLGPTFMRIFDVNPQQFGWLVSAYAFSAGVSGLSAALFIDRFDRKRALLFFYTGFCLGTFFCAMAEGYWQLLFARCLTGAFGGILISIILAIISDLIPYARRAFAMGLIATGFSLASIFGVPFGLYLAQKFSWHTPFVSLGILSGVLIVAVIKLVPSMKAHIGKSERSPLISFANIIQDPNKVFALIFMSCLILGQFTVIIFISPSLVINAGMTEAQLPLVYLIGGLCSIISGPVVGRLADRFGKTPVFVIGALVSLIPILTITHLGPTPLPIILTITSLFFISMSGRMVPAMAMVSASAKPEGRGGFMSFVSATQQFSSALASALAGWIIITSADGKSLKNYDKVGFIAFAFTLIAILVHFRMKNVEELPTMTEKGELI